MTYCIKGFFFAVGPQDNFFATVYQSFQLKVISFEPGLKVGDLDPVLVLPGRGIKILKCQHQKQTAHASSSCVEAVSLHTILMQVSSFPLDHITPPPCLQMSCALVWVRDNLLMI